MKRLIVAIFVLSFFSFPARADENIGYRPYEMVNAGRNADTHPPLVDFQSVDGWTVETVESEAGFIRSQEQRIFGDFVGKLVYKTAPTEAKKIPLVVVKPPQPITIPMPFDCVNWWVYGNNWAWESDASTPRVQLNLILRGKENREVRLHMDTVRWKEWFLIHRKLSAEQLKQLGETPKLEAIEIRGGSNKDDRTLYFGNLSFYKEELKPLTFEARPKQPFPNREETILPSGEYHNQAGAWQKQNDGSYSLHAGGKGEGFQDWKYSPKTGTLDDLTFGAVNSPVNGGMILSGQSPIMGSMSAGIKNGGFRFVEEPKEPGKLVSIKEDGSVLVAQWKFDDNEVEYRFQMKGKSLIVDVQCKGGKVKEFSSGGWTGLENPRLVQVPFLVGNGKLRPAVIVTGTESNPLFILSQLDHTRSNASEFFWENKTEQELVSAAACSRYNLKTDGTRNDCFERLFITVSTTFEEVLPNIPNDKSPWKAVTAQRVWRAHGSSNHEYDFKYWSRVHRYGVRNMLITDHEIMWRDGGESFTFRTSAAPGRGGDEGHQEYTKMIHSLGFIYGPYNNYTDYAPVNEYWHEDRVTRLSDGNFQPAWARCYNPKPAVAVEMEPKITEIVQKKFGFNTAYCDVHTAVQPWLYVDYDARVPGAGTFAATFYAYGEILLHQKKIWGGPVYSEGNNHWYYSGLTDGNYGQDQAYFVHQSALPWLVDFDLLKMHPLENNFGMGNPGMFYGDRNFGQFKDKNAALDRFLAATLAFGHTGFLAMEAGFSGGIRSYFTVQQIAERYGMQNVKSIRYADENGNFLTTSEAVATGAVNLNRIRVEYEDGLTLFVNGNSSQTWDVFVSRKSTKDTKENAPASAPFVPSCLCAQKLPPNGWYVHDPKGEITAWSFLDRDGCRTDYVDSPEYLFAEVRDNPEGKPFRTDRLLCDGQLIVLKNVDEQGRWEMIVGEANYSARSTLHAVRLDGDMDAEALALDFQRKEIGKAETVYSRGMVHVLPVEGAFSYLLAPKAKPEDAASSKRVQVVPGESVAVTINGREGTIEIPIDVKPGTLFWSERRSLDFEIVEQFEISPKLDPKQKQIMFTIRSNLAEGDNLTHISLQPSEKEAKPAYVEPKTGVPFTISFPCVSTDKSGVIPLTLRFSPRNGFLGKPPIFEKNYWLKTDLGFAELPPLSEMFELGQCQRGKESSDFDGKSGAYAYLETLHCGDRSQRGWAIHPPYMGGVGYVYLLSEAIDVPNQSGIVFSSEVGIRNGGDASDGVLYRVFVVEADNVETLAGEILWKERDWAPLKCDLSPWKGKTIRLRLVADVGPKNNSTADWAAWANFKLLATRPTLMTTLHDEPVELTYLLPEQPIRSFEDFSKAKKVELFFDGCGMDASDRYHCMAELNGVSLGRLPAAGGDESKGVWATRSIILPEAAVKTLEEVNRLTLQSQEDHFKIRRFRFVATFEDGSTRSSYVTNRTFSHPGSWKYAEGEATPLGKPFSVEMISSCEP